MKILVTGGAGFIGSHVVDTYLAQGHAVTVVDNLSSGRRSNLTRKARFVSMDIRSPSLIRVFRSTRFDVINHHAAQIDVRRSMDDPSLDASINIAGTLNLLECARHRNVRKFIFASSGGVMYGECGSGPAAETRVAQPLSPYGLSKLCAERYIRFYGETYGLDYTILRYGNVYGPRQDPHGEAGVVAIFCGRLLKGEPVKIFGTGKQVRDYVFVSDIARANSLALRKASRELLNIGTGHTTSVNELYRRLASIQGRAVRPRYAPRRAGELECSRLDARRASRILGWKPQTSIRQGLAETLAYFQSVTS